MAYMISVYFACFRKIVQAQDVINRSFDILTPVSTTRHFAKSVLRSQFQSTKASIKAVNCTQRFFTQLCHAFLFSWNKFIHNLFSKNKVREITVKRKNLSLKKQFHAQKIQKNCHMHCKKLTCRRFKLNSTFQLNLIQYVIKKPIKYGHKKEKRNFPSLMYH